MFGRVALTQLCLFGQDQGCSASSTSRVTSRLAASAAVFHAGPYIRRQNNKVRFWALCWYQGTRNKMGHCLFLNTEASGITIVFITPFDQIDFAEAHRISQAFRQAQKCHISLKPRELIPMGWWLTCMFFPRGDPATWIIAGYEVGCRGHLNSGGSCA